MHEHSPTVQLPLLVRVLDLVAVFVRFAVPWLFLAIALYLFRDIAHTLTGADSDSSLWLQLMGNVSRTRALAFVFGVLGAAYGVQQRNLRITITTRLNERIRVLEQAVRDTQTP